MGQSWYWSEGPVRPSSSTTPGLVSGWVLGASRLLLGSSPGHADSPSHTDPSASLRDCAANPAAVRNSRFVKPFQANLSLTSSESSQPAPQRCGLQGRARTAGSLASLSGLCDKDGASVTFLSHRSNSHIIREQMKAAAEIGAASRLHWLVIAEGAAVFCEETLSDELSHSHSGCSISMLESCS